MMSSSSSYQPEESEDASDSEFETRHSTATRSSAAPSSRPQGTERSPRRLCQNASRSSHRRVAKRTRETAYWDLRGQLPGESVGAYTELLEEMNSDMSPVKAEIGGSENYNVTQNGIVIWTPKEKEILFNLLDRKGKNGIRDIADAIGTKSELEVQEHLRLLHKGLERQHLRDRHARTVILGDVPATVEVGDECGRALDKYAEFLCLEEQHLENTAGRQRHYDAWIIGRGKAKEIDEQIEDEEKDASGADEGEEADANEDQEESEDDEAEESEEESDKESEEGEPISIPPNSPIHLCASLFTMSKWIRLSERFFMNPGGPRLSDNWTKMAYVDENPSITADAFTDFYAVAMSLTRRLVQSSLFFAMSRIRQMKDSGGRRKARFVKLKDVRTALDVLNMKQDRSSYWIGLARRCNLDVVDARHQRGWKNVRMSHNEVEDFLSGKLPESFEEKDISKSGPSQEHAGDESANDDDESVLSDIHSSPEPIQQEEQLYLTLEDEHAETVDQKTSTFEEQRLWQILGRPTSTVFDPNIKFEDEDPDTSRKPIGERKTKEELVDWREKTLYRSEWEEYGNDVFDVYEGLSENRRKRRRIAREEPVKRASPVETISDEDGDVEINTRDDDEVEEIDHRAVKLEAEDESEEDHDEAINEHDDSITSIDNEIDRRPVIHENEEAQPQSQYASRHSDESEYESENDYKPPQQAIKHEPSGDEDEGLESKSESDGESIETEHKPNITTRDDSETRSTNELEDDTKPKAEGEEGTDEKESVSSNQHDRSSSEEGDMSFYYQQVSQDHGLVKRE